VPDISKLEQRVRTMTLPHLKSDVKQQVQKLRQSLDPEDQALLILRIDRRLAWNEIGAVMLGPDEARNDAAVARRAASLRKRFERVKDDLKRLARENNLLSEE